MSQLSIVQKHPLDDLKWDKENKLHFSKHEKVSLKILHIQNNKNLFLI